MVVLALLFGILGFIGWNFLIDFLKWVGIIGASVCIGVAMANNPKVKARADKTEKWLDEKFGKAKETISGKKA